MKLKSLTVKRNHEPTAHPEYKWIANVIIDTGTVSAGRGYGSSPTAAAKEALEYAVLLATSNIREQIDKQLEVHFVS